MIFNRADILLPKIEDYRKWAVIACDQFTSQPEYWKEVQEFVKNDISSFHLILPEAELSEDNDARITKINRTMEHYLKKHIFRQYRNSYVYVERHLENGMIRKGIVGAIDLEEYDYRESVQRKEPFWNAFPHESKSEKMQVLNCRISCSYVTIPKDCFWSLCRSEKICCRYCMILT